MSRAVERLADLQYRGFDRMRSRAALDAARREGTAADFEGLRGCRQCLVVSFKRSAEPVPTPVNHGVSEDGRLYFRSEPRSAKVKRIRRDPHVRIVPCNIRGKPIGATVEGTARVLPQSEAERGERYVESNWSAPMKVLERGLDRLPLDLVYIEVVPREPGGAEKEGVA